MGNSVEYRMANREKITAYMKAYYLAHSTRPAMVPGAERESKVCKKCGVDKARDEFTVRQSGPREGHLSGYCKSCNTERSRIAAEEPSHYRRVQWPSKLKRLYGITVADYNRMLAEQGGCCAMCKTDDPSLGSRAYAKRVRSVFDVDHCHKTGRVRGLLCGRCNRLVGLAGDSVEVAQTLVKYLI